MGACPQTRHAVWAGGNLPEGTATGGQRATWSSAETWYSCPGVHNSSLVELAVIFLASPGEMDKEKKKKKEPSNCSPASPACS